MIGKKKAYLGRMCYGNRLVFAHSIIPKPFLASVPLMDWLPLTRFHFDRTANPKLCRIRFPGGRCTLRGAAFGRLGSGPKDCCLLLSGSCKPCKPSSLTQAMTPPPPPPPAGPHRVGGLQVFSALFFPPCDGCGGARRGAGEGGRRSQWPGSRPPIFQPSSPSVPELARLNTPSARALACEADMARAYNGVHAFCCLVDSLDESHAPCTARPRPNGF